MHLPRPTSIHYEDASQHVSPTCQGDSLSLSHTSMSTTRPKPDSPILWRPRLLGPGPLTGGDTRWVLDQSSSSLGPQTGTFVGIRLVSVRDDGLSGYAIAPPPIRLSASTLSPPARAVRSRSLVTLQGAADRRLVRPNPGIDIGEDHARAPSRPPACPLEQLPAVRDVERNVAGATLC